MQKFKENIHLNSLSIPSMRYAGMKMNIYLQSKRFFFLKKSSSSSWGPGECSIKMSTCLKITITIRRMVDMLVDMINSTIRTLGLTSDIRKKTMKNSKQGRRKCEEMWRVCPHLNSSSDCNKSLRPCPSSQSSLWLDINFWRVRAGSIYKQGQWKYVAKAKKT